MTLSLFDSPSTSSAIISSCGLFSRASGFGGLVLVNLFAWRATDPRDLIFNPDPVGPENDYRIAEAVHDAPMVICAWGTKGGARAKQVLQDLYPVPLHILRLTKGGHPEHPLYLPASLRPVPWQ